MLFLHPLAHVFSSPVLQLLPIQHGNVASPYPSVNKEKQQLKPVRTSREGGREGEREGEREGGREGEREGGS